LVFFAFFGVSVRFGAQSVLGRVVAHVFDISLIEVAALLLHKKVYHIFVSLEVLCAHQEQLLGLSALPGEHRVA